MNKVIYIDNGHGKDTPGKRSPDGRLLEYEWARDVARRIVRSLTTQGYDARLLVPEDYDVALSERVRRVNTTCRNLGSSNVTVVSVHINAAGDGRSWKSARGFLPFVSPNASGGSKRLARYLYEEAVARGLKGNRWVSKDKYAVKSLAMCRDTLCASVLTENLFMDNREDCAYLLSEAGRKAIAEVHVEAIARYLSR